MKSIEEAKAEYPWQESMGEISGFGGGYEDACRNMLYSGIAWLDNQDPKPDLKGSEYKHVFGIFNADSEDAKALEEAVLEGEPGCSGAMHHAVMNACFYIAKNGWNKYVEAMTERNK